MVKSYEHIRNGMGSVRPYLHGPLELLDFLKHVFGAVERERHDFDEQSCHVELQIDDSIVVVEAGDLPHDIPPWRCATYVYVANVDDVYSRALALGATSLSEPTEKPYQERQAGFHDVAGNTWWISTYKT